MATGMILHAMQQDNENRMTATSQTNNAEAAWARVLDKMRQSQGDAVYRNWLKPLTFIGIEDGKAVLGAPTRFMREWVQSHYMERLCQFWPFEYPGVQGVQIVVRSRRTLRQDVKSAKDTNDERDNPAAPATIKTLAIPVEEQACQFGSPLDPRFTFENFVVGRPNELAYAVSRRVAESNSVVLGCNPLFLYGGVGLGKTHLMHAIAWHIRRQNPGRRVMYLSAEKFMYQFIRAIRTNEAIAFKEQFRSVDVLMVDDVQFIGGKESTQEEFFHTFNALIDQNKQLVISADRSPSDLSDLEERIRSRLGWGLVADINTTNYELRLGILQSKVEKLQVEVPGPVLEFLAHRITSNVRELEGALNRVVAHATLVGREITLDTTQEVLQDLLRANDQRVNIDDIQRTVARHYNIKVSDMHSARRSIAVARPRQIAMYLSKQLTSKSLPEIGRRFGGKDHTTVMHAIRRIEELSSQDPELREDIELLNRTLRHQ